ncbi:ATP-binding protein [Kitasatospora sp. NPDC094015]|uniref:ATP-binding protein n=1 Tax=Kitasatospora sp. NPDC094015 TaxID=3155205 RepID=UPI00331ADDD7
MSTNGGPPPTEGPRAPYLPPGGQVRRLPLLGLDRQVARGREFARRALADWYGWTDEDPGCGPAGEDVLLLVSELLANAAMHAGGTRELILRATPAVLRVEVVDGTTTVPRPRTPHRPGLPGGHGLHVVERLSDRWGADPGAAGKTVWLEVDGDRLSR